MTHIPHRGNAEAVFADQPGTPSEFLARMEAACEPALRAPAVIEGFQFRNQRDFAAFWATELEKFRGIVQAAGIRPGD